MGRGLRPSAVPSPNSYFLLYKCIPTTGWMLAPTFLVIAPPHSNTPADSRPRAVTSQLRACRHGGCEGERLRTGSGWETPRVGGACETDGPHCKISGRHPRAGRYKRASPALGIVPVWSRMVSASLTYRRSVSSPSSSRTLSSPQFLPAMVWVTTRLTLSERT